MNVTLWKALCPLINKVINKPINKLNNKLQNYNWSSALITGQAHTRRRVAEATRRSAGAEAARS
jgi:hypothetical protein